MAHPLSTIGGTALTGAVLLRHAANELSTSVRMDLEDRSFTASVV